MKSDKTIIRKNHMEHIKNTTKLIGIKDLNIKIMLVLKHTSHIEIRAELDYPAPECPHCQRKMIKYDFQRPSTIPLLDVQGMATVLKLKKRRFQCKSCRKISVTKTSLVKKHCQISQPVWAKITQLLIENRPTQTSQNGSTSLFLPSKDS